MFAFRLHQTTPIPLSIEMALNPGELHALVGPSGAGKTTCLRALAGLLPIADGRIVAGDQVWLDDTINLPAHQRKVGLVFQSYALFPHMSAVENVMAAMPHLSRAERQKRAPALLERVRLKGLEERLPAALSGGQQQRVAVARALAREPDILLLDEPFAAVDQRTRQRLYRELALLRRELAMPILLVTHDLAEARMLADRMTVLYQGEALATAEPETLVNRPTSVTVARLMGHRNIFDAKLLETNKLAWGNLELEITATNTFELGAYVQWMIPPSAVLLHRRDRPSRGERENPISGVIREALGFGEVTQCLIATDQGHEIAFSISTHAAKRNDIKSGAHATVSLLAEAIHLMPPTDQNR